MPRTSYICIDIQTIGILGTPGYEILRIPPTWRENMIFKKAVHINTLMEVATVAIEIRQHPQTVESSNV